MNLGLILVVDFVIISAVFYIGFRMGRHYKQQEIDMDRYQREIIENISFLRAKN